STWNDSKPLRAWQIAAVDPPLWGADGRICASESNTSIRPPAPKDRSPAPVGEQAGAEAVVPLGVAGAGDSARGRWVPAPLAAVAPATATSTATNTAATRTS